VKRQPNRLIRDTARETRYTGLVKNELDMFNKSLVYQIAVQTSSHTATQQYPGIKKKKEEKEKEKRKKKKKEGERKKKRKVILKILKRTPSKPLQSPCQNKIIRNKIIIVIIII